LGKAIVDTTYSIIGGLDFNQKDGLLEARFGSKFSTADNLTASGGDLTTTTMDSISMERNIQDVEAAATEGFVTNSTFFGGLLEGGDARVLDFVKELALLGGVDEQVGTSGLGAEAPNLLGIIGVPFVIVGHDFVADLDILLGGNLLIFDGLSELITEGASLHVDTVMLVSRLGKALLVGKLSDGFLVGDNGVTLL
jgi:hypothetical protein